MSNLLLPQGLSRKNVTSTIIRLGGMFAVAVLALGACEGLVSPAVSPGAGGLLAITPGAASVHPGSELTFAIAGGEPPYTYELSSGGGDIVASTDAGFTYRAPPASGTASVQVTDARANAVAATISVGGGDAAPAGVLALNPQAVTLAIDGSLAFAVSGGAAPYRFSVLGSGSFDAASHRFMPQAIGTDLLRVVDADGTEREAAITVVASALPVAISPSTIGLLVGEQVTFTAAGGSGGYGFAIEAGAGSIDAQSGRFTASAPITGPVVVTLTDRAGDTVRATVDVFAEPLRVSPATATLATGTSLTFSAAGGVPPYVFGRLSGTMDPVTGHYTAPEMEGSGTVRASDATGQFVDAPLTFVTPTPSYLLSISPSAATVIGGSQTAFSAAGGTPPYTFSLAPAGPAMSSDGVLTAPLGSGTLVAQVTDAVGRVAQAQVINLGAAALLASPAAATVALGAELQFVAVGGVAPYRYAMAPGSTGSIDPARGTYLAEDIGTDVVWVTDAAGATTESTIVVQPLGSLAAHPRAATVAADTTIMIAGYGGVPPYQYTVHSGPGSIDADTGRYSAPAEAGAATVLVTDNAGAASTAQLTIAGPVCGGTFAELEPNNAVPLRHATHNDFGIELEPGCSVSIVGVTDPLMDVFAFDAGTATEVLITVSWSTGRNSIDLLLRGADRRDLRIAHSRSADVESYTWTVDAAASNGFVVVAGRGWPLVAYTVTLTGA